MAQNLSHDLYAVCVGNGIYSFTEEGLLKGSHCPKINSGKEADLPPLEICVCYAPVSFLSCATLLQSPCLQSWRPDCLQQWNSLLPNLGRGKDEGKNYSG